MTRKAGAGATDREVTRGDALLLVVPGSVSGELQKLRGEVLQDCSQVHTCTLADPCGEAPLLDEPGGAGNREGQPGFLGVARPPPQQTTGILTGLGFSPQSALGLSCTVGSDCVSRK